MKHLKTYEQNIINMKFVVVRLHEIDIRNDIEFYLLTVPDYKTENNKDFFYYSNYACFLRGKWNHFTGREKDKIYYKTFDIIFQSNNFDKAKKHLIEIRELSKLTKQYNI